MYIYIYIYYNTYVRTYVHTYIHTYVCFTHADARQLFFALPKATRGA